MASNNAYSTIRAKLVAGLGYPVLDWDDTENELEQSDAAFLTLEEDYSTEETLSIGSPGANWLRETGALRVHVFTPSENGLSAARLIGEEVRDLLRYSDLLVSGSEYVSVENCEPPSNGMINESLWNSKIIGVDYRYDTTR